VTFDDFRATSRFVPDYLPEPSEVKGPCLVYHGGLVIDLCVDNEDGPFMLIINTETVVSRDLVELERRLYDHARDMGYL
jgi:hypothetical protein